MPPADAVDWCSIPQAVFWTEHKSLHVSYEFDRILEDGAHEEHKFLRFPKIFRHKLDDNLFTRHKSAWKTIRAGVLAGEIRMRGRPARFNFNFLGAPHNADFIEIESREFGLYEYLSPEDLPEGLLPQKIINQNTNGFICDGFAILKINKEEEFHSHHKWMGFFYVELNLHQLKNHLDPSSYILENQHSTSVPTKGKGAGAKPDQTGSIYATKVLTMIEAMMPVVGQDPRAWSRPAIENYVRTKWGTSKRDAEAVASALMPDEIRGK